MPVHMQLVHGAAPSDPPYAHHPQGRALLRQWCLAPVADAGVLCGRHDAIDTLMAAPDLAASVLLALKKVGWGAAAGRGSQLGHGVAAACVLVAWPEPTIPARTP